MHIYAFGSVCRGEVDIYSDIDLLAITDKPEQFDGLAYSIYSHKKIKDLWEYGNPFAWHLFWESKILFSFDGDDFLKSLDKPTRYKNCLDDCLKFYSIFNDAVISLTTRNNCMLYDIAMVFLAIRNIASCYTLGLYEKPNFSRNSAFNLDEMNIPISQEHYKLFERARILTTRGQGEVLTSENITNVLSNLDVINDWILNLLSTIEKTKI